MGRPRLHDESTERDLLVAAEALLAADGVEGLSVRRLAEAAGTTPRAIYSVFGGKEGLLRALFREAFHALSADIDALPVTDDPLADLVRVGVEGFRGWALARPHLFRLVFQDAPLDFGSPAATAGVEAFARLEARIERCVTEGLLPADCQPRAGIAFHALCEGLTALELRRRFPLRRDEDPALTWASALRALVAGFRTA